MFNDSFIESLPDDPILAIQAMCNAFKQADGHIHPYNREPVESYDKYLEALGALTAFSEAYGLTIPSISLGSDFEKNISTIRWLFGNVKSQVDAQVTNVVLRREHDRFLAKFKSGFSYEFSDGDLQRIQAALNELRDLVASSEVFDANHKQRILRKLEALQAELHKRVSSLDNFWGLIGEAGVAIGKFGKDAKPFVDRIREIAWIVWRTQARAEELPSGTPLPLLTDGSRIERWNEKDRIG